MLRFLLLLTSVLTAQEAPAPHLGVLKGHKGPVSALAFSPDSASLASGGRDHEIHIWDLAARGERRAISGHDGPVLCLAYSPDGASLASGGEDNTIRIWDVATGQQKSIFSESRDHVLGVAFSPDGLLLASASKDSLIRVHDLKSGKAKELVGHSGPTAFAEFYPDGQRLISWGADSGIRVWRLKTGTIKTTITGLPPGIAAASSPDRGSIALALTDNTISLWSLLTGKETARLSGHQGLLDGVVFSSDGRRLASVGKDQTTRLWSVDGGSMAVLSGHTEWTSAAAFSPDGKTLASASWDKTIRLWDIAAAEKAPAALPEQTKPAEEIVRTPAAPAVSSTAEESPDRLKIFLILAVIAAAGTAAFRLSRRKPKEPPLPHPPPRTGPIDSPLVTLASEAAPQKIILSGKYEVLRRTRLTPLGILYEGLDRGQGQPVTIRKLREELKIDAAGIRQLLEKSRGAASLRHRSVVSLLDVVESDGTLYAISTPTTDKPLSSLLEERQHLSLDECRTLLGGIAEALGHAHQAGVAHGDLNPDSLLVDAAGEAKLADFAITRLIKEASARSSGSENSLITAYSAPERISGELQAGDDLYALAVTLYQTLTGNLPFPGPDFNAQKREMMYADPSQIIPGLPRSCGVFFRKALSFDPGPRFQSASELAQGFQMIQS